MDYDLMRLEMWCVYSLVLDPQQNEHAFWKVTDCQYEDLHKYTLWTRCLPVGLISAWYLYIFFSCVFVVKNSNVL